MNNGLINLGFGNTVSGNQIIAIISPDSVPVQRLITEAQARGQLIDYAEGRSPRAVIILVAGGIILSAFQPETIGRHENRVRNRLGRDEIERDQLPAQQQNKAGSSKVKTDDGSSQKALR
jgi:extracellular matrix regulatory protein A